MVGYGLMSLFPEGNLIMAAVLVLQIPDHPLKLFYLDRQFLHQLLVAPVAGAHRVECLLQGVYHAKQLPDIALEVVYLVDVILALHIRQLLFSPQTLLYGLSQIALEEHPLYRSCKCASDHRSSGRLLLAHCAGKDRNYI